MFVSSTLMGLNIFTNFTPDFTQILYQKVLSILSVWDLSLRVHKLGCITNAGEDTEWTTYLAFELSPVRCSLIG